MKLIKTIFLVIAMVQVSACKSKTLEVKNTESMESLQEGNTIDVKPRIFELRD